VTIPDRWLGEIATPQPVEPPADPVTLITAALDQPIGAPPLKELAQPGQQVALIIDDYTRKTPIHLLLPPVLQELSLAGVAPADIRLVVAPGTHRPMSQAEIMGKIGAELAARYEVVNIPSTADSEMVYLGRSANGIPAWVNRAVVEADLRVGLGMITPHLEAGFSGGAKIILPGVCSEATVDAFHAASAFIPDNQLGLLDAPLRRHLEQFVAECVPLEFIVNVITTLTGELYRCVAGHFSDAHRAGVSYARQVFGTPVKRRYPIVVANCSPYDIDLWQSIKGVYAGDLITADGGDLIIVTAAPEGNSNYPLTPGYCGRNPVELQQEIRAGTTADAKQAATGVMIGRLKQRINLALVSTGLTSTDAAAMGLAYYNSVEAAVDAAINWLPPADRPGAVAVLPQAGLLLPLLP
jgi:nickel-dependent lactate racemase